MAAVTETEDSEGYVLHRVDHFRQRFNWDCGVSCVLMLLPRDQREHLLDRFTDICDEEGFQQSTWTIDLCYLLKRFGIEHHMYTTMLGVNEEYKKHGYYSKIIDKDRARVQARFAGAAARQVSVSAGAAPPALLAQHLRRGPALVLVDAGLLVCDLCKHNKLKAEFRRCFGGGYRGHYILVVGRSPRADKFMYRDPALPPRLCAVSGAGLQRARAAPGTDHDCVLVYRDYTDRGTSRHTHTSL